MCSGNVSPFRRSSLPDAETKCLFMPLVQRPLHLIFRSQCLHFASAASILSKLCHTAEPKLGELGVDIVNEENK